MIKFKEYINEKNAQGNNNIKYLIAKCSIPLDTDMMDRLGYSYNDVSYHMTHPQYLSNLKKIQNSKKQISAFTKGGPELMKLPSNPTILVKLEGNVVIDSDSDMWTLIDEQGRRWISLNKKNVEGGTVHSEKMSFFIEGIKAKIIKDLGYEPIRIGLEGLPDINNIKSKDKTILYKRYFEEVENYIQKDGYRLLNKHFKENITFSYNELIVNNFKIIGAYSLDNNNNKSEIENAGIKYLGILTQKELKNLGR